MNSYQNGIISLTIVNQKVKDGLGIEGINNFKSLFSPVGIYVNCKPLKLTFWEHMRLWGKFIVITESDGIQDFAHLQNLMLDLISQPTPPTSPTPKP